EPGLAKATRVCRRQNRSCQHPRARLGSTRESLSQPRRHTFPSTQTRTSPSQSHSRSNASDRMECEYKRLLSSSKSRFVLSASIRVHPRLLVDSPRAAIAADRLALTARNSLGLGKHAQKILAQNLANILFTVTALQQLISNIRQ